MQLRPLAYPQLFFLPALPSLTISPKLAHHPLPTPNPTPAHPPQLTHPPTPSPWLQLAYEAEFFTGADLSALLSEAQLTAVHETLDSEEASSGHLSAAAASQQQPLHKHQHPGGVPVISKRHLETALAGARPSVPEDERDRLEGIYFKFQQSREPGGSGAAAVDKGKGKKVSWA